MPTPNKRYLILYLIILATIIFTFRIRHIKHQLPSKENLKRLPYKIKEWVGEDIKISNDVYEILGTKDVILRRYKNEKDVEVILALVYSRINRDSVHPPEYCYLGEGAKILKKSQEDISLNRTKKLRVNRLLLQMPLYKIKAWYWYGIGNNFFSSYYFQQLYALTAIFKGKAINNYLVRVSVNRNDTLGESEAKSFIRELIPLLKELSL